MPSPIAHSAMGIVAGYLHPLAPRRTPGLAQGLRSLALVLLLANIADLDFLLDILLQRRFHHTFTHSIIFTLGFSALLAGVWALIRHSRFDLAFSFIGVVYGSHVVLDMLGGGPGVQLLWPFSFDYVRFPWEVFPPVHYSRGLFDPSHWTFILLETIFSAALVVAAAVVRARLPQRPRAAGQWQTSQDQG